MTVEINEIWYVPVLPLPGRRRPMVCYEHMAPTRKGAISNLIVKSFGGKHDWQYRKRLGWTIERVTVTNGERA